MEHHTKQDFTLKTSVSNSPLECIRTKNEQTGISPEDVFQVNSNLTENPESYKVSIHVPLDDFVFDT